MFRAALLCLAAKKPLTLRRAAEKKGCEWQLLTKAQEPIDMTRQPCGETRYDEHLFCDRGRPVEKV